MSFSGTFKIIALLAFLIGSLISAHAQQSGSSSFPVKIDEAKTDYRDMVNPLTNKKADFKNFPTAHYPSNTAFLYRETPAEFQHHPEFGTIPYQFHRKEMVELIQKRTEKTRYFVNPNDPNKFTIHQSYGSLHYRDENGWWRTIDPRLRPNEKEVNVYHAPYQPTPTKVDLNKGFTSIVLSNKFELKFNQAVKMYAVYEDGRKELITIINATPAQTSVGKDGAYSTGILTGLDREVLFEEGKIKTNFVLNQALPSLSHLKGEKVKYITFEEELSLASDLHIEPDTKATLQNGYISGDLVLKDKAGNTFATWEQPLIYDQAGYLDGLYMIRKEGKKTLLTFAVDAGWLFNDARQYPIVIDPTIRTGTSYDREIKFKNNATNDCWSEYCQEETPDGFRMPVNLPPQGQISTVYFDITVNIDGRVIFNSPVKEADFAFAFAGPCNRSPEVENKYWTCGRRTITNPNAPQPPCATLDRDGNPIFYVMENAGTCIDPVCTPSTVDFFLQTTGCNCGATTGCSNECYYVKPNEWRMFVDGETMQPFVGSNVGSNDTTYVCSGEVLKYSADAKFGVPPYKYRWEEKTTGATSANNSFTLSGLEEGKMYDLNLFYSDNCNDEKKQQYIVFVRKGPELSFKVDTPSCPNVADGKITSKVEFANPAVTQPTSPGCPLSKQDEASIEKFPIPPLSNGARTPYRGSRFNSRMLFLVRADEIKAANPQVANGGKLTSIAFFVSPNKVLSKGAYENFTIKISTTPLAKLRNQDLATYKTKTAFGPVDMRVNQGWNVHTFSTGFVWNGTDNLIFDICHSNRFSIQGNDEVDLHEEDIATGKTLPSGITVFTSSNVSNDKVMCGNNTSSDYTLSTQRPNFKLSFCQGYELLPNNILNKTGTFDRLKANKYTVRYVDPSGCSYEKEIDIPANEMNAKVSKCPDDNGFIFAEVTGGRPPYEYKFELTDSDFKRDNRSVYAAHILGNTYRLFVRDKNGCLDTFKYDITPPKVIEEFTQQTKQVSCFGVKDAIYQITTQGGEPPVTVRLYRAGNTTDTLKSSNDGFGTYNFDSLGAGNYRYVIKDADLCKKEGIFTITEPLPLEYTVTLVEPAYCNEKRAVIRIDFVNGTKDYTLKVDFPDNTTQTFTTGNSFYLLEDLGPGIYKFSITDAGKCAGIPKAGSENPITIPLYTNFPEVTFVAPPTDPTCPNTKDGVINLTVAKGVVPYQYRVLKDGAILVPITDLVGNNVRFNNLTAGKYFIEITDSKGCKDTIEHTLLSAEPFVITKGLEQTVCINQLIQLGDPADRPTPGLWKCDTCRIGFFSDASKGIVNRVLVSAGLDYDVYYEAKGCRQPVLLKVRQTTVGGDAETCENNISFTPTVFNPAGGQWSSPQIANIDPATGAVPLNKTLAPGVYDLIYNANVGGNVICPDTMKLTVKAEPKPESANRQFCIPKTKFGGSVDLAQGGDSPQGGTWVSAQAGLISDAGRGVFEIGQTNGWGTYDVYYVYNGCSSLVRVRLGGVEIGEKAEVCESDPSFKPPVAEPTGGSWSSPDTRVQINPSNGEVSLAGKLPKGDYSLIYTEIANDPNSCKDTFTLTVKEGPKLTTVTPPFCISLDQPTGIINLAQKVDVTPKGGTWFNNSGDDFITDTNQGLLDISKTKGVGTYKVGYLFNGCALQIDVTLSGVSAGEDGRVCENAVSFQQKGHKPEDKFWFASDPKVNINSTTGEITLNRSLPAGDYSITYVERLNDPTACKDDFKLTVLEAPKAEFDVPPYPTNQPYFYAQKETLNLVSKSTGTGWNYTWNMGDGKTLTGPNISHTYDKKGNYTITLKVVHENLCEEETSHTVAVEEPLEFALPLIITPNDDGFNDYLEMPFAPDYDIKLTISDRYGNYVYRYPNDGNRWLPAKNIGEGTYFYVMELYNRVTKAKLVKAGNISILR